MTHDELIVVAGLAIEEQLTAEDGWLVGTPHLKLMCQDFARAAIRVIAPAVLEEAAKVVLDDGNYRKNNRGDAYIELLAMKIGYEQ